MYHPSPQENAEGNENNRHCHLDYLGWAEWLLAVPSVWPAFVKQLMIPCM